MKATALKYIKNGLSVIVTDSNKRALYPWKEYQERVITPDEITAHLSHQKAAGIAIICGSISGGLEVVDIDLKYDLTGTLFDRMTAAIKDHPGLYDKLLIIKTRSGGYHIYYRCEVIEGNQKLAMRPATPEELRDNPQIKHLCVIETRGQAGYVVAPPSDGYVKFKGTSIQTLTIDEREALLSICRSFNEVFETPVIDMKSRPDSKEFGLSPFDDYNNRGDVVGLLRKHGWAIVKQDAGKTVFKRPGNTDSKSSGDFNHNMNWFSVFTTNSPFTPNKAYLPYAVFATLECNGDFKEAARRLAADGYGEKRQTFGSKVEREIFKRKQDGMDKPGLVTYLVQHEKKSVDEATEIINTLEKQWGEKLCTFWDIDKNGNIIINRTRLERFLTDVGGFHLYFYDKNSNIYRIVRVKDGFIEDVSTEQIKKFIKAYITGLPETFDGGITPKDLLEVVYKGGDIYFNRGFLEFIDSANLNFLRDTADTAYIPFRKGVVVIDKNGVTMRPYGDIGAVIWKSEVIDFDISIDQDFDSSLCEFYRFIECICDEGDADKVHYCLSLIGYLLHKYKDPSKPFAVILAEETENESNGGGTGKGILVKAISYLINTERVDGKNFKLDKTFAFQRVGLDTKLVAIEDVRKNVDFEGFYSIITEGITVEKKNKDELFINYKDSPKIMFTTNYTIPSVGNHAKRRQRVFEFTNYFSSTYTPMDMFKHKLFDDWDNDEWNRFYNLFFFCLQVYLREGVKESVNSDKLRRKHIRLNFGEEFLDYWDELCGNGHNNWHGSTSEYQAFLKQNDFDKKDYSQKRFKKALNDSAEMNGMVYQARRNRQAANQGEFKIEKVQG